jgi:hypothetical protein
MRETKENEVMENAEITEENAEVFGVGTYTFKHPTKIEGDIVTEISYDFTKLNGKAVREARSELAKRSYFIASQQVDEVYHAAMFALAADISLDAVEAFSIYDYGKVAGIAQVFLNAQD